MSTAIDFRFSAGRYHATPWGSHVNEAAVEWPPSPWRILRALIATWHRKVDVTEYPEDDLAVLVHTLAAHSPYFRLPSAAHTHSRHYMPTRDGKSERRTLIFDAFARVDPTDPLVVAWPEVELDGRQRTLLQVLVDRMGYLGRAESWVEGSLLDSWDGTFDCEPIRQDSDGTTESGVDEILLAAPVEPSDYTVWRAEQVERHDLMNRRLNRGEQRLLATLPPRLIDALRLDTGPVQKEGWSEHPGMRRQLYLRPKGALAPRRARTSIAEPSFDRTTTATLVLYRCPKPSSPLPRLVDAIKIGERVRDAAMAMHKAENGSLNRGRVPPVLSGHDMPEGNRHQHAFYLPEDADGDGRIDRLVVHARAGLGDVAIEALSAIRRLWLDEGSEWGLLLENFGSVDTFADHPYFRTSRTWKSVTPYLHPWYRKKRFMHVEQLQRECSARGLPTPNADRIDTIEVHGRDLRPTHFHRFRKRRGSRQPDTRGSFWQLTFPAPVAGPIALGFGCHYGLGIFRAVDESGGSSEISRQEQG